MAEFQEVMRQWGRYCKGYTENHDDDCDGCPFEINGSCNSYAKDNAQHAEQIEKHIMQWAAEHPEAVYPSIAKYFERFGIIIRRDGSLQADFFKANEPMSAYMANLLGISPEEGENEKAD